MKLLLDIGNSRLKWATAKGTQLLDASSAAYGAEGVIHCLEQLDPGSSPQGIYVSNVAGAVVAEQVRTWAGKRWSAEPVFIRSSARACGVENAYSHPEKLGVDRWVAIIAAYHRGNGPACVADAGTALTVDGVAADGTHQGGLITPGVSSMRMILDERTQLTIPSGHAAPAHFGKNTDEAIASGTLQSALCMVQQAYQRLSKSLGEPPRALLTGGEAFCLHEELGADWELVPHLVLEGLAIMAEEMDN